VACIEACGQRRPRRGQGPRPAAGAGFLWEGSSDPDSGQHRSLRTATAASRPRPLPQGSRPTCGRSRVSVGGVF